jgi:prepilin-type N-terminal cleavage/methylation domain-containing protein
MAPARKRRGMTLIEIMIALVLLGIVSGVIMRVIMRQQRFYQGVNQIMTQRSQLRQATGVLPSDLRSLSSVGGDILVASDSSMEFMMNVGTGVVCALVPGGTKIVMPPEALWNGQSITSWYGYGWPDPKNKPKSAYTVYIYNPGKAVGNDDDIWQKFSLTDVTSSTTACLSTFTTIGDAGKKRPVLELSSTGPNDPVTGGPLSQYIGIGAPVRIMKQVRYKLYTAGDGKWYLGYSDYDVTSSKYDELSPVGGPYDAYASGSGSATGLGFRYYDVDGTEIASGANATDRARIARVDLIARARTATNVRAAGFQAGLNQQYKDSLAVSVMLRNRQ